MRSLGETLWGLSKCLRSLLVAVEEWRCNAGLSPREGIPDEKDEYRQKNTPEASGRLSPWLTNLCIFLGSHWVREVST